MHFWRVQASFGAQFFYYEKWVIIMTPSYMAALKQRIVLCIRVDHPTQVLCMGLTLHSWDISLTNTAAPNLSLSVHVSCALLWKAVALVPVLCPRKQGSVNCSCSLQPLAVFHQASPARIWELGNVTPGCLLNAKQWPHMRSEGLSNRKPLSNWPEVLFTQQKLQIILKMPIFFPR